MTTKKMGRIFEGTCNKKESSTEVTTDQLLSNIENTRIKIIRGLCGADGMEVLKELHSLKGLIKK